MTAAVDRRAAWDDLASPAPARAFEPDTVADLPGPAQRLLTRTLAPGVALAPAVIIEMEGEIELEGWIPFRARQVLRPGHGLVWNATAGRLPLVFEGGDALWRGRGSLDFRLWGLFPVARAAGHDVDRSAVGRLAAETVVWAPQAMTPQMGATWSRGDENAAVVSLPVGGERVELTVTVNRDGLLEEVATRRWGDPDGRAFGYRPFGAAVDDHAEFDGITICTTGRVGWWWGTARQDEGEFFRFQITSARFVAG